MPLLGELAKSADAWDLNSRGIFPYRFESGIPHQKQMKGDFECMFRDKIAQTSFSTATADGYFNNINAQSWDGDTSFVSTLRALIALRMGENDTLYLTYASTNYTADFLRQRSIATVVKLLHKPELCPTGWITVHSLDAASSEDNLACLAVVKSSFTEVYPEWKRLGKITEFYRNTFGVECFVNTEQKKTVIFCEKLDIRRLHYLQCSVLAFLPWYFDPEKGVADDEMRLIESLREKSSEKYEEIIEKLAKKYDFRTLQIRRLLTGFESVNERKMLDRTSACLGIIDRDIESLTSQISEKLRERREKEIMLMGLKASISNPEKGSELAEYFETNKNLTVYSVNEGILTFAVNTYCSYFDEDMASDMIENPCSYIYAVPETYKKISDKEMKMLMHAIFTDGILKLRFCAAYTIDSGNCDVRGFSRFTYGTESKNRMPNPHIEYHACLGTHRAAITEALKSNNYIGAVEQCVASAKNLNFADSTVISEFMKDMFKSSGKFIELPDGKIVSPKEAVEFLGIREEQNEQIH